MEIFELILTLIGLIFIAYLILVLTQIWPLVLIALGLLGVIHMIKRK